MRVLIVHPGIYVYGGAELVIVKLTNYLTKKSIENCLLTSSIVPEMQKDLLDTEVIIQEKSDRIPFSLLRKVIPLHKGIRNNSKYFDVINLHNYPAELSIFPFHKPAVWLCNEPPEVCIDYKHETALLEKLKKKIILSFDKFVVKNYVKNVVVADEFNAKRFRKIYGFNPEVINYGIDYDFFCTRNENKGLDRFRLSDHFIVLHIGMLTNLKNQLESIKTIEKLKIRIPNIKLVLAGWGDKEYVRMLESYIKEKNLDNNVIITGQLDRESVRDLYHTSDILLHPVKSQGGWLAPFEALCAKKPIVVSREMTAADIIERENIGIVTDNYTGAIEKVYNNPEKYYDIADKGGKWVRDNLSWDNFCQGMLNVFNKSMEEK